MSGLIKTQIAFQFMFCPDGVANGETANTIIGREAQGKEFFTLLVLYKLRQTPAFKMIINWYSSGRANWETGNTLIGCQGQGKRIHSQKHLRVDFFYTVRFMLFSVKTSQNFFQKVGFWTRVDFFSKALFNSTLTLSVCNAMWKQNTTRFVTYEQPPM